MLTGGCFCGAVRYALHGKPFHATLCHCSDCRRIAAAPAVAWITVPAGDFHIIAGTPKRLQSSPHAERRFCGDCGTGLTYQHAGHPGEIDITTCSLDHPEQIPPADQTFTQSRLPWMPSANSLPEHETTRDPSAIWRPPAG